MLAEKTIGLSDLEVAAKLMLSEWAVRSIVRRHCQNAGIPQQHFLFAQGRRPATV